MTGALLLAGSMGVLGVGRICQAGTNRIRGASIFTEREPISGQEGTNRIGGVTEVSPARSVTTPPV
eukprot:963707-Prorocentrum_minimum.AAC.1